MNQQVRLLLRFGCFKLPITLLSMLSLWAMRHFIGMFWAAWTNSLLTQIIEFLVLKTFVFPNGKNSWFIRGQFAIFWMWAMLVGIIEGLVLESLERLGWPYLAIYVVGHIPTFFLRFLGDQRLVFRKRNGHQPPGSS